MIIVELHCGVWKEASNRYISNFSNFQSKNYIIVIYSMVYFTRYPLRNYAVPLVLFILLISLYPPLYNIHS